MEVIQPKRYILSGGPGCGKTKVAEKLKSLKFPVIEEQARLVIKEQMRLGTDSLPWKDIHSFSRLVLNSFLLEYSKIEKAEEVVFSDRGPFDIFGYLKANQQTWDTSLVTEAKRLQFNKTVFFFPPWRAIYQQDEERLESFEEGISIANALREVYLYFGFQLVEVPFGTVEERTAFILEAIHA